MIDLYTWGTPNGRKVSIMLEALRLQYNVHPIDILAEEQFGEEFLQISPNNKIPAIVDHDGPDGKPISVFESGAILLYLAEKCGEFLPDDLRSRTECMEWLMWQMGGLGPMAGQAHHFLKYAPHMDPPNDLPYAKDRYRNETARLYGVLDRQLSKHAWVAGDFISIADFAIWGWASLWEGQQQTLEDKPHMARWLEAMWARPGVKAGRALYAEKRADFAKDKDAQERLFKKDS
jgi:GST-like protein